MIGDELEGAAAVLQVVKAGGVLLLLSVFFAYLLAPAVDAVRRRGRVGRGRGPMSAAAAILLLDVVIFTPAVLAWRSAEADVRRWVAVTAPETVDRLFRGGTIAPLEAAIARAPLPARGRQVLGAVSARVAAALERETRRTLAAVIAAAPYAAWLAVAPIVAFVLLTSAPAFQRSTVRVIPHGHLQWRAEQYLHDVNSALAGWVRAQTAAALIVGVACVAGFAAMRVPSAVSLGVTAGVLEFVPVLGPLTLFLVAAAQAGSRLVPVVLFLGSLRVLQDYVVYPRLIRRGMHLSTTVVILTVWTGAVLAHALGVVLAIPLAGFLSVSIRHWREYREIERLVAGAAK